MSSQERILNLLGVLATVSVTGIGLAVGGVIGATVLSGIGLNLGSNIIQGGCSTLKERWLSSENGLLNHDIQKALARAFIKALSSLEEKYLDLEQTRALKKHERESYRDLFRELKANAQETLLATIERIRLDPDVRQFLFAVPEAGEDRMWKHMVGDDLIAPYGSDFQRFIRDNLTTETLFWFGEELKTDSPECNKAWRAFQRMLLEGIYAGVTSIQANQALLGHDLAKLDGIKRQLEELREEIGSRLPGELFQKDLETAVSEIKATLQTISQTSRRIDQNVETIRQDVKTLLDKQSEVVAYQDASPMVLETTLSDLRRRMLAAHSRHDLKKVFFETEAFLGRHPHHADALQLKDQLEEALVRESARKAEPPRDRAQQEFVERLRRSRGGLSQLLIVLFIVGTVGLFAILRRERVKESASVSPSPSQSGGVASSTNSGGATSQSSAERELEYRIMWKEEEIEYLTRLIEEIKPRLKREERKEFDERIEILDRRIASALPGEANTPLSKRVLKQWLERNRDILDKKWLERNLDIKLEYLREFYESARLKVNPGNSNLRRNPTPDKTRTRS